MLIYHFFDIAATTPAIVVVCLGATLFLVGIIAVTTFFFRRKSSVLYRKSGVYLTNRSPISEEIPLRSQIVIRRKSDATCGARTPHLVMKKSPSPPFAASTSKNASPGTPPTEEEGGLGGRKINRNAIAIHTNPICNTATYCEVHGSTKCNHAKSSNHLVKRENSKSPRTSPQISPSTSTPANLGSHETHLFNQRNGNSTDFSAMTGSTTPGGLISTLSESTTSVMVPTENRESATIEAAGTSTIPTLTVGGQNNLGVLHFRIRLVRLPA